MILSNCILTPCLCYIYTSLVKRARWFVCDHIVCGSDGEGGGGSIRVNDFQTRFNSIDLIKAADCVCINKKNGKRRKKKTTTYLFKKIWWKHFRCSMNRQDVVFSTFSLQCLFCVCVISIYCSIESLKSSRRWVSVKVNSGIGKNQIWIEWIQSERIKRETRRRRRWWTNAKGSVQ